MAFSMVKFAMLHTILGSEVTEYPACGKEPFGVASLTLSNPQEKKMERQKFNRNIPLLVNTKKIITPICYLRI